MNPVSDKVRKFFEDYEKGGRRLILNCPPANMGIPLCLPVHREYKRLKRKSSWVLPKRTEFFQTVGLVSSQIQSLAETRLDDHYLIVKVDWIMRFEKEPAPPLVAPIAATYILFEAEDALRIVFQLDHQDLIKRVQELGLLPVKG